MIADAYSEGVKEKKSFKVVAGKFFSFSLLGKVLWGQYINDVPNKSIHFENASVRSSGKVLCDPVLQVLSKNIV